MSLYIIQLFTPRHRANSGFVILYPQGLCRFSPVELPQEARHKVYHIVFAMDCLLAPVILLWTQALFLFNVMSQTHRHVSNTSGFHISTELVLNKFRCHTSNTSTYHVSNTLAHHGPNTAQYT